ncbi:fatty acid amide hydrolase-like isoform X2 [Rhodamnia argentea]|uniref:Fatty acid amide hydrolase-like isoform X2 n=1 Tax=Rhodamnia argentea TaxID=178133 RepID=A0A8B8QYM1_9MYRT|nr:fatty acid amide hydrolase-like isoform X2 [Rhodamnia argentea]
MSRDGKMQSHLQTNVAIIKNKKNDLPILRKCENNQLVSNAEIEEPPVFVPLHPFEELNEQEVIEIDPNLSVPEKVQKAVNAIAPPVEKLVDSMKPSFRRWTIMDYSRAYSSGVLTPLKVAQRFIAAVKESSTRPLPMAFFINCDSEDILRQAKESTLRYERGEPISALDGVPVAVKDEIDCSPYPTTGGTKWLHKFRTCQGDACCVMRLRSCGAILVGKTNMHELGAGTSGINPHYGTARNPYDSKRIAGGSSSGSAAVVSAGLCPVALGVDGGGSVRMPAALCGVVGLKPTFGRVPHEGVLPLNWTVGMVGILAGTIEDAFITYAAISGQPVPHSPTLPSPKEYYPLLKPTTPISGIRLAKYRKWFDDCRDEIKKCCSHALDQLHKQYGWETLEVTIPEIEVMRLAHYTTIASECHTALSPYLEKLDVAELGWDARVALGVYGSFSSQEYIKAQRIRNRQLQFHRKIFAKADVIVSPTIGVTAYEIFDDARETGELDYINGAALVRYSIAGNFLGLPTITIPVGYDKLGLPIGLQFIGRPWSEPTLIHVAHAMQALCISECGKPEVFYDLLKEN